MTINTYQSSVAVELKEGTAETILKMVIEEVQQVVFCPEGLAQMAMQLPKLCPARGLHNGTDQWLAVVAAGQHLERPTQGLMEREGWNRRRVSGL
jgi:hypothetical protein